ncbi:MAG: glycerophosphodiester phosphodiesterase family protein [Chloroflexota bacterium]
MPATPAFYLERPLVIAHRGARDVAPENTLAAFHAALAAGADGIEFDVTRCASGEIVVIHDDTVARTTDGQGAVVALPLGALRALDAGAWFGPAFRGERIPLLGEVLDAVGGRLRLNIEIKGMRLRDDGLEAEIAAMVRRRGLGASTLISSFNPAALWRMRRAAPELARALLYARGQPLPLARAWVHGLVGATALHPHYALVDAAYLRRARRAGLRVNVWTVNDDADLTRLSDLGVDGLITDHPARALALMGR